MFVTFDETLMRALGVGETAGEAMDNAETLTGSTGWMTLPLDPAHRAVLERYPDATLVECHDGMMRAAWMRSTMDELESVQERILKVRKRMVDTAWEAHNGEHFDNADRQLEIVIMYAAGARELVGDLIAFGVVNHAKLGRALAELAKSMAELASGVADGRSQALNEHGPSILADLADANRLLASITYGLPSNA